MIRNPYQKRFGGLGATRRYTGWRLPLAALAAAFAFACQQPADEILERGGAKSMVFVKEPIGGNNIAMAAQEFHRGSDIYMLSPISPSGALTNLTAKWTRATANERDWGAAQDPEVSFDGKRILFSMVQAGSDDWRIFELDLESGQLTNLTPTTASGSDDINPAYIDDQRIVFGSNRNKVVDEYERREVPQLFVGYRSGPGQPLGNPRQITFNQSHDQNPFLHSSGKIYFARWDHLGDPNKIPLFTVDPDGTNQFVLYGADETMPSGMGSGSRTFLEARELADGGIVSSMMERTSVFEGGALCILDLSRFSASPEIVTPSTSPYNTTQEPSQALFKTPYPILDGGKERLLLAQSPRAAGADVNNASVNYDLFVMDKDGKNMRLIHGDPSTNDFDPVVVAPRTLRTPSYTPDPLVEQAFAEGAKTGIFFTADVYSRMDDNHMKPSPTTKNLDGTTGQARFVRFMEAVSNARGMADVGNTEFEKQRVVGYGDVRADGSFSVEVPANKPLHLQVLDENGHMLVNQLQWINVMPGERRVCTGCHGPRDQDRNIEYFSIRDDGTVTNSLDGARNYLAGFHNAQNVTAHPSARTDTVDFFDLKNPAKTNTVQHVMDGKCNSCHGQATAAAQGGSLVLENVPLDSLNKAGSSTVYERLTNGDRYITAKPGTSLDYVNDNGARQSPLAWVLYHKQLSRTNETLFRAPDFDHSTLWAKDSSGRIDPFKPENVDLLTIIEWMDMGIQFSNSNK